MQYTRVVAPDDGVITSRTVVVGQIAQAGGEMLRLLRQGRVEWRAEVPEGRLREVKTGQTARVTTADGMQLIGKVRTVAPTIQSGTRTGLVYVDLPKPESARPGMFARGEIETSKSAAVTLPLASIVVRDGYSYVFVVNDKQGVERRRIKTGALREGRVEVISGLEPTDRVVERGAGFLKDGDTIRVVESDEACARRSDGPCAGLRWRDMNLVTLSIHRPVPVMVLFVALTLAGFVGFTKLGVQDRPDMDIPTVTVTVNYPGVPPSQLETEVTRKIEDSVATATGIDHIRSTVTEGLSTTVIEFDLDRDVSEAVDDVRDAVSRIRSNLPGEIEEPIVSRVTTAGSPVVTYGVSARGMSEEELSWFVDLTVARELSAVEGMGAVKRVGGVDREIRVDLDPDALNALGTTAGDISRQLRRTQVELPGGEARIGNQEQSVRTVATAASVRTLPHFRSCCRTIARLRLDAIAEVQRPGLRAAPARAAGWQAHRRLRSHACRRRERARRGGWREGSGGAHERPLSRTSSSLKSATPSTTCASPIRTR